MFPLASLTRKLISEKTITIFHPSYQFYVFLNFHKHLLAYCCYNLLYAINKHFIIDNCYLCYAVLNLSHIFFIVGYNEFTTLTITFYNFVLFSTTTFIYCCCRFHLRVSQGFTAKPLLLLLKVQNLYYFANCFQMVDIFCTA